MQVQNNAKTSGKRTSVRALTSEILALEIASGGRFDGDNFSFHTGRPTDMSLGLLPEPYHAAALADGIGYVAYHHETPIGWVIEDGTWQIPDHKYSATTSTLVKKLIGALDINKTKYERI